jgi:hypothetical protein
MEVKMKYYDIKDNRINGFYDLGIHKTILFIGEKLRDGFYVITDEEHKELLNKQSEGYILTCNLNGSYNPQKLGLGETWDGKKISSDLAPLKEKLEEEITAYRDLLRETSTVDYNGHLQRYRKSDLSDIDYYQGRLEKAQIKGQKAEDKLALEEGREAEKISLTMTWYFYDGTTAEMDVDDFDDLVALTDNPIEELYRKEATLKAIINELATVEELESFDISINWVNA